MKEDLFIHFFNRELYRSLAIKEFPSANFALKIVVLACSETIHIPLSSLWENWNQIHSDKFKKRDTVSALPSRLLSIFITFSLLASKNSASFFGRIKRDGGCSTRLIQQIVRCAVDNCKLIFEERSRGAQI